MMRIREYAAMGAVIGVLAVIGGCGLSAGDIQDIIQTTADALKELQQSDPRTLDRPVGAVQHDVNVDLEPGVQIVENIAIDVTIEQAPELTLVGFDNQTDYDVYVDYFANDVAETAYVLAGDTLLLEYDCLDVIEVTGETDIDPDTGEYLGDRTYLNRIVTNPEDFVCGDIVLIPIGPNGTYGTTETFEISVEIQQELSTGN